MSKEVLLTENKNNVVVTLNNIEVNIDKKTNQIVTNSINKNIAVTDMLHPVVEITTGKNGKDGAVFTPTVTDSGILSWSNNSNLTNPDSYDFMEPVNSILKNYITKNEYIDGSINSISTIELSELLI